MAAPEKTGLQFNLEVTPAQAIEVWNAPNHAAAIKLVARIASLPDYDDDPQMTIWVEFMYMSLLFGKENKLTPVKTLAFFEAVNATHAATVEHTEDSTMTKQACLRFFADQILTKTKALPPADRFTVPEIKLVTEHFQETYIPTIKLHQHVFTRQQAERQSEAELFLHTPAVPMPLSGGIDVETLTPAQAPAEEAPAEGATPAEAEAAPPPAEEAAPPAVEPPPPLENAELAAAIPKYIEAQSVAIRSQLEREYAAQEQALLDRISALEAKVGK